MRKEDFKRIGLHTRGERQNYLRHKREVDTAMQPIRKRIRAIILGVPV